MPFAAGFYDFTGQKPSCEVGHLARVNAAFLVGLRPSPLSGTLDEHAPAQIRTRRWKSPDETIPFSFLPPLTDLILTPQPGG